MKAGNLNNMIMKLLKDCKTWNGPVTSSNELINILKTRPCQQRFILRTEDGMTVLSSPAAEDLKISANFEINQLCVRVWMSGKDEIVWYVGYITEINEETH